MTIDRPVLPRDVNIEPAGREDVGPVADLMTMLSTFDNRWQTAAAIDHALRNESGTAVVARRNGSILGAATLTRIPTMPGHASARVAVLPADRQCGIGSALADCLEQATKLYAVDTVTCALRDDLAYGRAFATKRCGLAITNHSRGWRLSVSSGENSSWRSIIEQAADAAGVVVVPANIRNDLAALQACVSESLAGMPIPFDGTRASVAIADLRDLLPDNAIILVAMSRANAAQRPLGVVVAAPQEGGREWYGVFLGVVVEHRFQGVARALLTALSREAAAAGVEHLIGYADAQNSAVVALSQALNARACVGYWSMARRIEGDRSHGFG